MHLHEHLTIRRYHLAPPDHAAGVEPLGPYPERYWLPVVGPTALLAARALHRHTEGAPPFEHAAAVVAVTATVRRDDLAASLGVSPGRLAAGVERLASFARIVHPDEAGVLWMPDRWPTLDYRHRRRLPPHLAAELEEVDA